MARDNGYDDLLSRFEKKETKPAPKAEVKKPSPPPARTLKKDEFEDISSDSAAPKGSKKGGVYFSNPPRTIKRQAEREQGIAINGETKRRVNKRSQALKENAQAKTNKKNEKLKTLGIMLAIIIGVSTILCVYGIGCINDVLAINVDDTSVEVYVEKGMTDSEVIDILHDKDLINNKLFCKLFIKFFDKDGDYISGTYTLTSGLGVEKMISTMKTDYRNSETITLTFPEGWTITQIAEKLELNEVCTASSFISTLQSVDFSEEYAFVKSIPDKEARYHMLEGYIYPDTYEFYIGENASSVVRRFLDNFESKWTEEYAAQAKKRGLSIDEVIVMASIIQGEAANKGQMAKISSVLYNRLDKPNAFPLLQCDSTEDYLLKTIKPGLTSSVQDTQKYLEYRDSYDTYSEACKGLPVGAICNPGNDAIYAALFPADTNYLYFRHDVEGGVYYASSFAEHEANGKIAAKVG
ncbi:MAG: endolytic transglycosylase MltG [Clostridia bacterium]|nr:endolytic transglycosylase MltG [Clostridia bacterium]